jgi:hypothetical protein
VVYKVEMNVKGKLKEIIDEFFVELNAGWVRDVHLRRRDVFICDHEANELAPLILNRLPELGFIKSKDLGNILDPLLIMKPVYHKKEKTIVYQSMSSKEKRDLVKVIKRESDDLESS